MWNLQDRTERAGTGYHLNPSRATQTSSQGVQKKKEKRRRRRRGGEGGVGEGEGKEGEGEEGGGGEEEDEEEEETEPTWSSTKEALLERFCRQGKNDNSVLYNSVSFNKEQNFMCVTELSNFAWKSLL